MSRATSSSSARTASWLLHATERCSGCDQLYAYELEVRCVDCDAPYCPFCVVAVRGDTSCHECAGEEDAS